MQSQSKNLYDIIIIGAGPAGISAARYLQQYHKQKSYVVLEARDRVGGRVYSQQIDGVPIDLGAAWIHGSNQNNLHTQLISQLNFQFTVEDHENQYIDLQAKNFIYNPEALKNAQLVWNELSSVLQSQASKKQGEISLQKGVRNYMKNNIKQGSEQQRYLNYWIALEQNTQGTDLLDLDARLNIYTEEGEDLIPLPCYYNFIKILAEDLNIRLNNIVKRIQNNQIIKIVLAGDSEYTCKKLLITVPLGILKSQKIEFRPDLPVPYTNAFNRLGYAFMNKVILQYSNRFWTKKNIRIISQKTKGFFFTADRSRADKYILVTEFHGEFARQRTFKSEEDIIKEAHQLFVSIYGQKVGKLLRGRVTKWQNDEFALGAYSYFKVGSTIQDINQLKQPIENSIYFAGEYLYQKNMGCAYGAAVTAEQAIRKMVN